LRFLVGDGKIKNQKLCFLELCQLDVHTGKEKDVKKIDLHIFCKIIILLRCIFKITKFIKIVYNNIKTF